MAGSVQSQEMFRILRICWLALSACDRGPLKPPWGSGVGKGIGIDNTHGWGHLAEESAWEEIEFSLGHLGCELDRGSRRDFHP